MISINAVKRIYSLNIPNIFTTPANILYPRILSCHLRWIATVVPKASFLLDAAYRIESKASRRIEEWVEFNCTDILDSIDVDMVNTNESVNRTIWTMWWQGEDAAPELVESCINRMRQMAGSAELVVIDSRNYKKYVELPSDIVTKQQNGEIGMAHFSDVVRVGVLAQNGGLWIDSTMWVDTPIPENAFTDLIYSIRFDASSIIKADWGYQEITYFMCVMGGRSRYIYKLMFDILIRIHCTNKNVINYLIFDKVIRVIFKHAPIYEDFRRKNIEKALDPTEITSGTACYKWNDIITYEQFRDLMAHRRYTKLTYKFNYNESKNHQRTLFGWLMGELDESSNP